jgi:SET domain-containing protein
LGFTRVYTRTGAHTHTRAHLHETTLPKFPIVKKTTPARRIQTRRSGVHGKGVYALVDLAEGETVIEYVGEVISWDEALRRHPHDPKDPNHTFYFHIDENHVIDAKYGGNSSRWINHSCDPNCEAETDDGRVFIRAQRNIQPGEELFYDYGLVIDEPYTPALKKQYPCWCGAKNCRGTLLAPKRGGKATQLG